MSGDHYMNPYSIHPDTTVGPVFLTVSNLKRSEEFYREVLGFEPLPRRDDTLSLTVDGKTPVLELKGIPPRRPVHLARPASTISRS